ncbi:hypothetical protein [Geomonas agri]|uniref:hypothetical protein n=1 Tax=Geomonas agri TaxID=2873702 RepID=UPI001CD22423|nr:hypothetical protein [Geomonas agri]
MEEKKECAHDCKKHPCPDCSFCQWCSDDRCRMCLGKQKPRKKLSSAEQIALYESLNQKKPA